MLTPKKPLRADVYDTLELMALAFGGIAGGPLYGWRRIRGSFLTLPDPNCPKCAHGLLLASEGENTPPYGGHVAETEISLVLAIMVDGRQSDEAVRAINRRKGKRGTAGLDSRVTFREWCRQTGIVRADS